MEDNQKKLYRSDTDKMLCGVCGGIAEYFNVDSTLSGFCGQCWPAQARVLWPISLRPSSSPEDKRALQRQETKKQAEADQSSAAACFFENSGRNVRLILPVGGILSLDLRKGDLKICQRERETNHLILVI